LAPFYHGVASGDPTDNSVIIWTRITTTSPNATINWIICEDQALTSNCQTGSIATDASKDFTVKLTVSNLSANQFHYYGFTDVATGDNSVLGRTKTLPSGANISQIRLGVVSCSSYSHGYFHAYKHLKDRNDIDVILHLGDYIYEYGNGEYGTEFDYDPATEMYTLDHYRTRFSYYRLDPALRDLHQQYPFINIWDDHESTNDSYKDGAENHNPGEGEWVDRKSFSKQAYDEWLPVSSVNPLYRSFQFGDLMDLILLDTRLEGRKEQLTTAPLDNVYPELLGVAQTNFMNNGLQNSTATWKFLGQQIMVAPLRVGPEGAPVNLDQWDGYETNRNNLLDVIEPLSNVVVLTGDIHTSWANELPDHDEQYISGVYNIEQTELISPCANSNGVEFVTTSVTSPGLPDVVNAGATTIKSGNPHMKYVNLDRRGYMIMDITPQQAQADWFYVSDITMPNFTITDTESWKVNTNETCLIKSLIVSTDNLNRTSEPQPPATPLVGLPVSLIHFDGWNEGNINILKWSTASEINNDFFEIEKSQDGRLFKLLDKVDGNGTTTEVFNYQFEDKLISSGFNYYRLKQIDFDGSFQYSQIIVIENKTDQNQAHFFPNPCINSFNCTFISTGFENTIIEIIDNKGKVVQTETRSTTPGFQRVILDFSTLPIGTYIIRLTHGSEKTDQSVFIKM